MSLITQDEHPQREQPTFAMVEFDWKILNSAANIWTLMHGQISHRFDSGSNLERARRQSRIN